MQAAYRTAVDVNGANINRYTMRTIGTLLFPCLLALHVTAALPPSTYSTLASHMREVNAQWDARPALLQRLDEAARFSDEAERIATHLHHVRTELALHSSSELSIAQRNNRTALLSALSIYAQGLQFPQNEVLPYRNPIFIDPSGTACAVGQLMIESGHKDLAERISATMNLAYVLDMPSSPLWSEIAGWATEHGFTPEELAWIQPGYPPSVPWTTLGGGTDAPVAETISMANGNLFVAGSFTNAGGISCNGAAVWNGTTYSALGELPEGVVNCALEMDGTIYVGGFFNNGQMDLLHWDGGAWVGESVFTGKTGEVTALATYGGVLFAAGSTTGFAGTAHGIRTQVFGAWQPIGGELNGPIHALEYFDGGIVAGGAFTDAFLSTGNTLNHVARLTESGWSPCGGGLNGVVYDLLPYNGDLYATGQMITMMGPLFGLASLGAGAEAWEPLMPNIQNYITPSPVDAPSVGYAMVERNGKIYIAGEINAYSGLTFGSGVVVYNGSPDDVEPYANFNGVGYSIALLNDTRLVVGGASETYDHIISTDLTASIHDELRTEARSTYPNPAMDRVNVTLPPTLSANAVLRIVDQGGRTVAVPFERNAERLSLDVRGLAKGRYHIALSDAEDAVVASFVKQ